MCGPANVRQKKFLNAKESGLNLPFWGTKENLERAVASSMMECNGNPDRVDCWQLPKQTLC